MSKKITYAIIAATTLLITNQARADELPELKKNLGYCYSSVAYQSYRHGVCLGRLQEAGIINRDFRDPLIGNWATYYLELNLPNTVEAHESALKQCRDLRMWVTANLRACRLNPHFKGLERLPR